MKKKKYKVMKILEDIDPAQIRAIDKIIIHVSDTPDHINYEAQDIKQWHLMQGWSDIGYSYVIPRHAEIQVGRPIIRAGAHVAGHNAHSIGICWVGRKKPGLNQYKALVRLTGELLYIFKLDSTRVFGHYEFNEAKTCPNINMEQFRQDVEKWLAAQNLDQ